MKRKIGIQLKRISRPLALLISIIFLFGGVFLINKVQKLLSQASLENAPHKIKIANITDSSFIVSWITETGTVGQVSWGENANSLENTQNDLRDTNKAKAGKYLNHFVLVGGLLSQTKYYFKIIADGKSYANQNKPFEVTSALRLPPLENDLAQGKILTSDNQPAVGAIVYLSLPNTNLQSALTDSGGHWVIPLSTARTTDLKNFSNYDRSAQVEEIFVQGEKETASATLTTSNDNPVPDMKLGQIYNFQEELVLPSSQSPAVVSSGFEQNFAISSPEENEKINTQTPEFFGVGPKGQKLEIIVESEQEISGKTDVNNQGEWRWTPPETLTPGEHKITVSFVDSNGFIKKVSRSFTVLAVGESNLPSFTATPSGEIITPTPTVTPSIAVKITPTVNPTQTPIPPTPTTSGRATVPSGNPPSSGTGLPTWLFLAGGVIATILGLSFLLL